MRFEVLPASPYGITTQNNIEGTESAKADADFPDGGSKHI
jgi:hypothetical protein